MKGVLHEDNAAVIENLKHTENRLVNFLGQREQLQANLETEKQYNSAREKAIDEFESNLRIEKQRSTALSLEAESFQAEKSEWKASLAQCGERLSQQQVQANESRRHLSELLRSKDHDLEEANQVLAVAEGRVAELEKLLQTAGHVSAGNDKWAHSAAVRNLAISERELKLSKQMARDIWEQQQQYEMEVTTLDQNLCALQEVCSL